MAVILTFINVLLLYAGIYWLLKKITVDDSKILLLLTSAVVLLIVISYFYYLMLVLNQGFIELQLFLLIINLGHVYFTKNNLVDIFKSRPSSPANFSTLWALGAVFFLTIYFVFYESKYGGWDAWAIWNLHAKFLYHPELWHNLFSDSIAYSHPDYPLMLPSVVAFFWNSLHNITPVVPIVLSYGLLIIIPLLLYFSLVDEGVNLHALIALVIFVTDSTYKSIACSQEADTLLSLLILLVFIQYKKIKSYADNRIYILGFICASCSWVKNEGIVFCILFTLVFLALNYKHLQVLKKYFAGIVIPALIIISFKLFFSPANDLVAANHNRLTSLFSLLSDSKRYILIFKSGITTLIGNYMIVLVLLFAVFIFNRRIFLSLPFITISLLLSIYFVVYLLTPYDLNWHLSTSLYRLLQHVYPALIYLLLLAIKNTMLSDPFATHNTNHL